MTRFAFYIRTSLNHLRRGGQRSTVAVLCVAFGVMSLVAMTLLSNALERMLVETPQDLIGADISMDRLAEESILPEHIRELDELQQQGLLSGYTLVAYTSTLAFQLPGSGELHFPGAGIGIDPGAYPPIGSLTVESPSSAGLSTLLEQAGDVIISRDLALEHKLTVGDTLVLSDLTAGARFVARIRGIVTDTPNHKGSKLYYSLETAEQLAVNGRHLNTVLATSKDPAAAQPQLTAAGWRAFLASDLAEGEEQTQEMFAAMLNGAGVLGLLVSGVGTANTMQVLLRRRQREVAVWKTLGYRSSDLMVMFALEAGLLGLTGSLLGAGLGIAVSAGLVNLFSRTSTMLIQWVSSPEPVFLAVFVGLVTTVVFALWAIVSTSQVRPVNLLRGEPASAAQLPWFQAAGLLLVLAVPFTAVISLVMGSTLKAVAVLATALAGLVSLGGGLASLLWLVTRLLPLHGTPLLNMARANLRRRGLAPVFTMIALFVGVTALTLAIVVTNNADRVLDETALDVEGNNLILLAPAGQAGETEQALAAQGVEAWTLGTITQVRTISTGSVESAATFSPLLIARKTPDDYTISGAPWGSQPDGAYVPSYWAVPAGSQLEVTLWDGSRQSLSVAGTYEVDFGRAFISRTGVLLPTDLSQSIAPPDQVQYFAHVPAERLSSIARELGKNLTGATVINMVAYNARFTRQYHNLFLFAVSMASLALLAGALLMANSVSLSMLDRRYEIGVLKAMGYAHRHILIILVVEYALVTLVATGTGLLLVKGFLWLVGMQNQIAGSLMVLTPLAAGSVILLAVSLTFVAVLAVTWKPSLVSPLVVLNDRE